MIGKPPPPLPEVGISVSHREWWDGAHIPWLIGRLPLPDQITVIGDEKPDGLAIRAAQPTPEDLIVRHPLEIVITPAGIWIVNGTVGGQPADSGMVVPKFYMTVGTAIADLDILWSKLPATFDASNTVRTLTGPGALQYGAVMPAPDGSFAYCRIGQFGVSAPGATPFRLFQDAAGSLSFFSCSLPGLIVDHFPLGVA